MGGSTLVSIIGEMPGTGPTLSGSGRGVCSLLGSLPGFGNLWDVCGGAVVHGFGFGGCGLVAVGHTVPPWGPVCGSPSSGGLSGCHFPCRFLPRIVEDSLPLVGCPGNFSLSGF